MYLSREIIAFIFVTSAEAIMYKNCTNQNILDCPDEAVCNKLNDDFKCFCLSGYEINPTWHVFPNATEDYCVKEKDVSTVKVYVRPPADTRHLATGILVVLVAAVSSIAIIYAIKIISPVKRTKNFYTKLKRKHQNRHRLNEDDAEIYMTTVDTL